MSVPFFDLESQHAPLRADLLAALESVIDSNWLILGDQVQRFEVAWALACTVPYAVGVGNGLDALTISLRALGVGAGDEVIVPANTYIATWLAVTHAGATPVPVEPEEATFNLDPAAVEAAITSRTRAIMPVHLFGQPCRMDALMAIAQRYDLLVVEDNAQAHGARWRGQVTGAFGHCAGHSFYPTKNLGALGDAGAISTFDASVAERARSLRNYGSELKYHNQEIGWNSRLDEVQAAVLLTKLPHLTEWNAKRKAIAAAYTAQLSQRAPQLTLPMVAEGAEPVWHQYVVRTSQRDALQAHLTSQGISTLIHYPVPPHLQPAYATLGFKAGQFPISERMASTSLSLPIWPGMTAEQIELVVAAVASFGPAST